MDRRRQKQRWYLVGLSVLLVALLTLAFWQQSLSFGEFRPSDWQETVLLWGLSTLVGLGIVALGFVLFRNFVKLYVERRANQLGSNIKTKLVAGALGLTILPVVFLFFFAFTILNRTLDKWFNQPIDQIQRDSREISERLRDAGRDRAVTLADWIASLPETRAALHAGGEDALAAALRQFAASRQLVYAAVVTSSQRLVAEYAVDPRLAGAWQRTGRSESDDAGMVLAEAAAAGNARVVVGLRLPADLIARQTAIAAQYRSYQQQARDWRFIRYTYVGMLSLITLFILFVATWVALFLSRQIVAPIQALVQATAQVSTGHLDYRVETRAIDELAMLVNSFNRMTEQLEHSRDELDARRRFTEAILESIPTGVISLSSGGQIQRVNSALARILPPERAAAARTLDDLFSPKDAVEVRRLIRRAERTGFSTGPLDLAISGETRHLAVTVSALESNGRSQPAGSPGGCVIVLEDSSELLRAQKSAAWQEVAQRVAHEIKNPLTPIALSAERMSRLVDKYGTNQDPATRFQLERLLHNCTTTISSEVQALQTLVDEFSQFARFPRAQPAPGDLNEVVESAIEACDGRLDGVSLRRQLAAGLPAVAVDPEQFKRAIVNLVDNAVEAMQAADAPADKVVQISTALGAAGDTVELAVADSGQGIAAADREKLFLPYFSTRKRGTGLGLAIVSRIVAEHRGSIRVEDNRPRGARFVVEIPLA